MYYAYRKLVCSYLFYLHYTYYVYIMYQFLVIYIAFTL